jgi:hypothetical protein
MFEVPSNHTVSFQALKDVYTDLLRLGVVPTNRIPTKKSAFDPTSVQVTLFDADRNSLFMNFERVQTKTQVKFMTIINKPPPPSHQVISTKKAAIVASKLAKPEGKPEEVSPSGLGAPT